MRENDLAVAVFDRGFNCCQAMVSAYGPLFGLNRETGLRVAGAFGAGLGRQGRTCGVVVGGLIIIGLKYGRVRVEDERAKELTNNLAKEFVARFTARHHSLDCRDILGYDVSTSEGLKIVLDNNLFDVACPAIVLSGAEILDELLKL